MLIAIRTISDFLFTVYSATGIFSQQDQLNYAPGPDEMPMG